MTRLHLVTDSTYNLPGKVVERYDIRVVPVSIQFGQETFLDGIDLTAEAFYARVEREQMIPTTSQPPPSAFTAVYETLPAGDPILSIHVSGVLSGTLQSAQHAARELTDRRIVTFDSRSFSIGMGFLIWEAATLAEAGWSVDRILDRLRWRRDNTYLHLTTATLQYLRMSGRISLLENMVGSLLNVKPIITLADGRLAASGRQRTRARAIDEVVRRTLESVVPSEPVWLGVIHAQAREDADALFERLSADLHVERSFVGEAPPCIVVHGGPGVVGAFVSPAAPAGGYAVTEENEQSRVV